MAPESLEAPPGRSRARLLLLAALLAVVGVVLIVLSRGASSEPLAIRFEPSGLATADGTVWAASARAGAVVAFDADGHPVGATVRIDGAPARVAVGRNGLWVTDAAAGTIVPVAVATRGGATAATAAGANAARPRVFAPLQAGADATDVALAAGAVWVASAAEGRVYAVERDGASRPLQTGRGPVALAADPRRVVVADPRAGSVTVIDARARRIAGQIRVGGTPVDVALAGDTAWVVDATGGRIVAVDLNRRVAQKSIRVGSRPIAVATAGDDVYVLSAGDRRLVRVRDGEVRSRTPIDAPPTAIAADADHIWVAAGQLLRFDR